MANTKLIQGTFYAQPKEYEHLKARRDAYFEKTGRKLSISRFVVEQPDRQESELAALKRVHELDVAIVDLYRTVNTRSAPSPGKATTTKTHQSVAVATTSKTSDENWEAYLKAKEEGDTLPTKPNQPNPHVALLAELKERFGEN